MKHILIVAASLLWALPALAQTKPVAIDGDTIAVGAERIRIIGLDTPETYQPHCEKEQAAGFLATGRLQHLLNMRKVTIKRTGIDKYGRTLAKVLVGAEDVAEVMIREGVAVPYDGRSKRVWWAQRLCPEKAAAPRSSFLPD
jgi:endonuclease YncB( thermonuclease family)